MIHSFIVVSSCGISGLELCCTLYNFFSVVCDTTSHMSITIDLLLYNKYLLITLLGNKQSVYVNYCMCCACNKQQQLQYLLSGSPFVVNLLNFSFAQLLMTYPLPNHQHASEIFSGHFCRNTCMYIRTASMVFHI